MLNRVSSNNSSSGERWAQLCREDRQSRLPGLQRFWDYYRNKLSPNGLTRGQLEGLPDRLRGRSSPTKDARELVVENDIAWRIDTLVDFMFGRPLQITSQASDPEQRTNIEKLLQTTFNRAGGEVFFQQLALLGAVYGHIDTLVLPGEEGIDLLMVEPTRGVPDLDPEDFRQVRAYLVQAPDRSQKTKAWETLVYTDEEVLRFRAEHPNAPWARVGRERHRIGEIPVVHIQNLPQPFAYSGLSEVEPLIPLQDELNTRLSDRANRVTFQSFKMYLGKGIERFTDRPVGPGQMWQTDNPDAEIQEFGGDADNPSETEHIREIRDAMDKTSGVSPVAAGVIRGRVGNLTSENALRIVMVGLLAKTARKRMTYGQGIRRMCALILQAADAYGWLKTRPEDREVRLDWPEALPGTEQQELRNAQLKQELGVPRTQLLTELGYPESSVRETT